MFISNHLAKIIIPTAIVASLTAFSHWLGSAKNASTPNHPQLHSNWASNAPSPQDSTRKQVSDSLSQLALDGQGVPLSPSPLKLDLDTKQLYSDLEKSRQGDWLRDWRSRGSSWSQKIAQLRLDPSVLSQWIDFGSAIPKDPVLSQEVAYNVDRLSDPLLKLLFATPDSPGSIAIGTAEGTRTSTGGMTERYGGHRDPGNGAFNLGTFSYQHGANSPQQADSRQLTRLQRQITKVQRQAREERIALSILDLVAAADLLNQSPEAGEYFVTNLKKARSRGLDGLEALLVARMQSFVDPKTNTLEAAGFGNSWKRLKRDQMRRLSNLQKTLQVQGVI